jgi:transcriptional regulator with XRE-family HTH domain
MDDQQFIERLNYFRKINSYTLYELSKNSDIPFSTLYSMEHNYSMPSMHTFLLLCKCFRITPCEFFLQKNDTMLNVTNDTYTLIQDIVSLPIRHRIMVHEIIKICLQNQNTFNQNTLNQNTSI